MRTSVCITGSTAIRRASSFSRKPRRQTRGRLRSLLNTKRSEEHTSELQSRSDLVCRLLLEKKKKKICRPITLGEQMYELQTASDLVCSDSIELDDTDICCICALMPDRDSLTLTETKRTLG